MNRNLNVIGAGEEYEPRDPSGRIQLIEPLDGLRGTAGYDFVTSPAFKALSAKMKTDGPHQSGVNLNIKSNNFRNVHTSTATSGAGLTSIQKLMGVVQMGARPLAVEDLVSPGATSETTLRLMQEVSYTQAAAAVTETGALPQIAVTYTEVDFPVRDAGGFIEVSENLLADYLAVASFINERLPYQVDRAVDDQLFNGDGNTPNLTGILATSGIQTLAKGANTAMDLAMKLQTKVRWQNMTSNAAQGGFEPDAYVIHPVDWETLCLSKDANGQYFWKGPFTGAYGKNNELVEYFTLWGKKVVVSPVTAQGTMVCGAWRLSAQKFDRQGALIEMTNCHGDNFIKRIVTIRATRRLALAVYRPASFVTGTGL